MSALCGAYLSICICKDNSVGITHELAGLADFKRELRILGVPGRYSCDT